jgi:hypothetical protein
MFPVRRRIGRFRGDFRLVISQILVSVGIRASQWRFLGPRLRIQKFRSRGRTCARSPTAVESHSEFCAALIRDLGPALQLLRIKTERLELPAPFGGSIAKPLDPDAARQTTFDCGLDEVRREERERDRHVDLTHTAFLTCRDLPDVGDRARHDLVEPATASGDCADETCTALYPRRSNFVLGQAVRDEDLPGFPGRRLLPGDCE